MFRLAPSLRLLLLVIPLISWANPMRPDPQSAQNSSVPDKVRHRQTHRQTDTQTDRRDKSDDLPNTLIILQKKVRG